ncbi:MAG: phosphotransferase, partial [Chlorobi bacterium]|nr:phosphotransferase [Chlorobiota bacterium]
MQALRKLFRNHFGIEPEKVVPLKQDGSTRQLYRMSADGVSAVGVDGSNPAENAAFLGFTRAFRNHGLPVPEIFAVSGDSLCYLEEDLGDVLLQDWIRERRTGNDFTPEATAMYKRALRELTRFQIDARDAIDYGLCYQYPSFADETITGDLHYFRDKFLGTLIPGKVNPFKLEMDFTMLRHFLVQEPRDYFLYRDFQSRNIMIHNGELHFIDYQSGRRGALQYDPASLLYDARAGLPEDLREELIETYIAEASRKTRLDVERWKAYFPAFALVRVLQALGAFGNLGWWQGKADFLRGIRPGLENAGFLARRTGLSMPELERGLDKAVEAFTREEESSARLTVHLFSFSYHFGTVPTDPAGNGGGFVFDCRCLPNPGRVPEFADLTGKDLPVQNYIQKSPEAGRFLEHVMRVCHHAVESYLENEYTDIYIALGCTGGQHRSVYCAERVARFIGNRWPRSVEINLHHA